MEEITKALAPHITTALIALITAASAWAVAWLQGRAAKERAIVQGAVLEVEARKLPAQQLGGEDAKSLAMELARARGVTLKSERLEAAVQATHDAEKARRESEPPTP